MMTGISSMNGRLARAALFSVVIVGSATLETYAQHGYRVTKQIRFDAGTTSARIEGIIPGILEGHEYLLKAKRGQTVTIGLFSEGKDVGFSVTAPDGKSIDETFGLRSWHSQLRINGVYHVVVNTDREGKAPYTLDVSID